jgi:hypothetical protein
MSHSSNYGKVDFKNGLNSVKLIFTHNIIYLSQTDENKITNSLLKLKKHCNFIYFLHYNIQMCSSNKLPTNRSISCIL